MNTKALGRKRSPILVTMVVIGLISLVGLVIDGSNAYFDRRNAQNAADSAAQAAALALARGQDITTTAQLHAANAGYDNDGTRDRVRVNNPPDMGCKGKNSPQAGDAEYVQVIIQSNVNTFFAQVVGIRETCNCVEAIEHATQSTYSFSD